MTLLADLLHHRLVPVVVIDDAAHAHGLAEALIAGGLPVAEITFRTAAAPAAVATMAQHEGMLVGAGTVRTPEQVDLAVQAGARYVVSPGLSVNVVRRCQELGVTVLPGTVTASEVQAACELGLDTVKFFPAETSGGVAAIKALAAPFPDVSFVPTGGVTMELLPDYLSVPAVRAVGSSALTPRDVVARQDFATVESLVRQAVELVASLRGAGA